MGSLPRSKLAPKVARKMLLEAHKWTGEEALADGLVDAIAPPEKMFEVALEVARKWAPKAKMGVYGVLRAELYGDALKSFQHISYVHSRSTNRKALVKVCISDQAFLFSHSPGACLMPLPLGEGI
jgi:enoyl-CoA hydratase/carnithine racemase